MLPRSFLPAALVLLCGPAFAAAQEPIRFARTPDISPDGKLVAFSYFGDIWLVEAIGGVARPVTMHEAHDVNPCFSPDGKWIAFSSNRNGGYDVFVIGVHGGKVRRLTYDSSAETVVGWTPDSKGVIFASARSTDYPQGIDLYTVPVEGGTEKLLVRDAKEGAISPKGDAIAYVRGQGTWYRKGYRGSSNDDIWVANPDGTNHRRFTDFNGQDTAPMWSADGRQIFYVSEQFGGQANIVCADAPQAGSASATAKPKQVTFHQDDSVRRARMSANGEWIVYECGADLWVVPTKGGSPRKLAIEVHAEEKSNSERTVTLTNGITEFAPSPDEKNVVVVAHGDLFLMPLPGGGKARQLTNNPAYDHNVTWAPDGKSIIFASDRSGHEDLYLLQPDDPEHPELVEAHRFKTKQLTNTPEAEIGAGFSPDGKKVAFIRSGKLWTMNPDGSDQKAIVDAVQVIDYDWSPDSKWFVYARLDGSFSCDLFIVPAAGGESKNITRYATYNSDVTWSSTGQKIAFVSQRRGGQFMYVLSLQRPAVEKAPAAPYDIEWDEVHLRATEVSPYPAESGSISPDGSKVAFRSSGTGGDDLYVANSDGSGVSRLTTGNVGPRAMHWSKRLPGMIYFLDRAGNLRGARGSSAFSGPGGPSGRSPLADLSPLDAARIPFSAKVTVRRDEEFTEMFDQSWRALADNFYDPKLHGSDWKAVREKYRPLVQHTTQREDLYALISLMMGELNASHLGITGFGPTPEEMTADLGLIYDPSFKGPGLKIAEVLKRGPADKRGLNLKAGEVIVAIDRTDLTEQTNLSKMLNGKANEVVALDVLANPAGDARDPKNRRRVEVRAADRKEIQELMYDRWVQKNADRVTQQSKGTLGYVHIPSMDEAGLEKFKRALYSENFDKEAIVIDVRNNGGGFTHDQVLNYLTGKEHTFFRQRDGGEGMVMRSYDRKWTKPMIVLTNNRSFSDAEIFPHAFRALGLGKVVGQPTGGMVIGTSAIRLIDGSVFRVPRTGVFTAKGVNMEREGVVPDVIVEQTPDELAKGVDSQIEKAVQVLTADVAVWKKNRQPAVTSGGTTASATPAPATPMAPTPPGAPGGRN
jgi:tricorn protease